MPSRSALSPPTAPAGVTFPPPPPAGPGGPPGSAGGVWGKETPAGAVGVDSPDREGIRRAVTGLAVDPEARRLLGRGALAAGAAAFSYTRCRDQFFSALRRAA